MNEGGRAQVWRVLAAAIQCVLYPTLKPRNPEISKKRPIKVCAYTSDEGKVRVCTSDVGMRK